MMNLMQIPQKVSSYSCSNLNKVFGRNLLRNTSELQDIATHLRTEYVGTLPREIIHLIEGVAPTKAQKVASIKGIMEAFSQVAEQVSKGYDTIPLNLKFRYLISLASNQINALEQACPKVAAFLDKHPKLSRKIYEYSYPNFYHEKLKPFQETGALPKAQSILTSAFKKAGILQNDEVIELEYLGGGMYAKAYKIIFPARTGIKPKVQKIFKNNTIKPDKETYHGVVAETNAMLYVKDKCPKGFEQVPFVEGYFGSLKRNYMVTEYAPNYAPLPKEKQARSAFKDFAEQRILMMDVANDSNIVNGRNVDYGGAVNWGYRHSRSNRPARKPTEYDVDATVRGVPKTEPVKSSEIIGITYNPDI